MIKHSEYTILKLQNSGPESLSKYRTERVSFMGPRIYDKTYSETLEIFKQKNIQCLNPDSCQCKFCKIMQVFMVKPTFKTLSIKL